MDSDGEWKRFLTLTNKQNALHDFSVTFQFVSNLLYNFTWDSFLS